jgi:hypothetical protein
VFCLGNGEGENCVEDVRVGGKRMLWLRV